MGAWRHVQRIRRSRASLLDLSIAQLTALTFNINRDPKAGPARSITDFALFQPRDPEDAAGRLSSQVANTALALRRDQKHTPLLLVAWPQILAAATADPNVPHIRALASRDQRVLLLCPSWEGANVRAGLLCVSGLRTDTTMRLYDIDRPLAGYDVHVPARKAAAWLQAGLLLPPPPRPAAASSASGGSSGSTA